MAKADTRYLNLDEIMDDEFVVKLGGVEHRLKPATLEDFITNYKDLQTLGMSPSVEDEFEISKKMLIRAFPTMTEEMIKNMTMPQMNTLIKFAHDANGQKEGEQNLKGDKVVNENPPMAA